MSNILSQMRESSSSLDVVTEDKDTYVPKNKPTPQKWLKCPQREDEIKQLCEPNGVKHLLYGAPYIAVYFIAMYFQLTINNLWTNIALAVVLGNGLYTNFILHHDCMHGSAFKNDFFNRLMGRLYAMTFTMTFTVNRQTHMRHHAHITDPERDPDAFYFSGKTSQIWLRIWRYYEWYTMIALTRYGKKVRNTVLIEQGINLAFWAGIHYALYMNGMLMKAVWIFWLPLAVVALIINPITRGYEHSPITMYPAGDPRRLDMSKNAITIANSALGWFWANITYHVEHHAYVRCPFYNLQKVYAIFQQEKMQYLVAPYPLYRIWRGKKMLDGMTCNEERA